MYDEQLQVLRDQVLELEQSILHQQSMIHQLSEENEQLNADRVSLLDKLTSMKNVVAPKLQAEMVYIKV